MTRPSVSAVMGSLAQAGPWLAVLLTGYFLSRAAGLPFFLLPAMLLAAIAYWAVKRKGRTADTPATAALPVDSAWAVLAACVLVVVALAPTLGSVGVLAADTYPHAFLFSDDANNLMIAQGLARHFPPPDLDYLGRPAIYHLGGPMLAEMLHRYSGLPLNSAFFAVCPLLIQLIAVGSVFHILARWSPDAGALRTAIGAIAIGGLFTLDPYNLVWNARNIALTGDVSMATLFGGMPIAALVPGPFTDAPFYGTPLALAFFLALLANLDKTAWPLLACTLFAIFLSKASVFLPIGLAWGIFATYRLVRFRDFRLVAAGALALVLCLIARPFVVEPNLGKLAFGWGFGLDVLAGWGRDLANALHVQAQPAVAAIGLAALLAGTHAFGAGAVVRVRQTAMPMSQLTAFTVLCMACAAAVVMLLVFRAGDAIQRSFEAIHGGFRDRLWIAGDYLFEMGKLSIGEARAVVTGSFALLAGAGLIHVSLHAASRWQRQGAVAVLALAAIVACGHAWSRIAAPMPAKARPTSAELVAALRAIPVSGSIVFTNDCAYDRRVELHLPLMNAALPALFGHQFWGCNFMFGANFAAPGATEKLQGWRWFWDTPIDSGHRDFLQRQGITHILVHRELAAAPQAETALDATDWTQALLRNRSYSVYLIKSPNPSKP